jgi:peptide chain release factor 1
VRLTHLPTNTVVQCQDERSQIKNMAKAMTVLRSRLLQKAQGEADAAHSALRKSQVGSGDRSEKIRTYNVPQGRVTDHRVGITIHQIDSFMAGQIEPIIEPLRSAFEAERLQALEG